MLPPKTSVPIAVMTRSGSKERNATKMSAMDKCSKKKYMRVSFRVAVPGMPPRFLLIMARMEHPLLASYSRASFSAGSLDGGPARAASRTIQGDYRWPTSCPICPTRITPSSP